MEMLSGEYGWTPKQIREMSASDVLDYLAILDVKTLIRKSK